jgi:hypothetical protein
MSPSALRKMEKTESKAEMGKKKSNGQQSCNGRFFFFFFSFFFLPSFPQYVFPFKERLFAVYPNPLSLIKVEDGRRRLLREEMTHIGKRTFWLFFFSLHTAAPPFAHFEKVGHGGGGESVGGRARRSGRGRKETEGDLKDSLSLSVFHTHSFSLFHTHTHTLYTHTHSLSLSLVEIR